MYIGFPTNNQPQRFMGSSFYLLIILYLLCSNINTSDFRSHWLSHIQPRKILIDSYSGWATTSRRFGGSFYISVHLIRSTDCPSVSGGLNLISMDLHKWYVMEWSGERIDLRVIDNETKMKIGSWSARSLVWRFVFCDNSIITTRRCGDGWRRSIFRLLGRDTQTR